MKKCTKCKKVKKFSEFYKKKGAADGLRSWCKKCQLDDNRGREARYRETRKNYRERNLEDRRKKKKIYYQKNKNCILESNRQWRQTFKGRLLSYKKSAEKRGISWLLEEKDFEKFWQKPCFYCGGNIETIGIDRLNSKKQYETGNCVPCCSKCNKMKMKLSKDEFVNMIKKIHKNLKL